MLHKTPCMTCDLRIDHELDDLGHSYTSFEEVSVLASDIETEVCYGTNLRIVIAEAGDAERKVLRTIVDRARANRLAIKKQRG